MLWVLGDGLGPSVLGPALSIALKAGDFDRLVVITDEAADAAVIARRATYFATPSTIDVASVTDTSLTFCEASGPELGLQASQNLGFEVPDGVDVVVEHGVTSFEVLGLEIGRMEDGFLVVGVGKHDREGHRMANPDQDPLAALAGVAARVRKERTWDAPGGAMTSISRERWLRSIVVSNPDLVGLPALTPVEPPLPRTDLRDVSIAPAVGDGVVVAFSVGVDPDLVPSAADVRALRQPDAELVLVVPAADNMPNTQRVAAALKQPARIVSIPDTWPSLGD